MTDILINNFRTHYTNPMPPKPLEVLLKEFVSEQVVLDGNLELGKNFIRQVWSAALQYGASCLPKEAPGDYSTEDIYLQATVSERNTIIKICRGTLLEEADKAVKGV